MNARLMRPRLSIDTAKFFPSIDIRAVEWATHANESYNYINYIYIHTHTVKYVLHVHVW